jgi:hypothetical protein
MDWRNTEASATYLNFFCLASSRRGKFVKNFSATFRVVPRVITTIHDDSGRHPLVWRVARARVAGSELCLHHSRWWRQAC